MDAAHEVDPLASRQSVEPGLMRSDDRVHITIGQLFSRSPVNLAFERF